MSVFVCICVCVSVYFSVCISVSVFMCAFDRDRQIARESCVKDLKRNVLWKPSHLQQ